MVLSLLLSLALIDLVATMIWLTTGIATEANPIMNYFLAFSLPHFAIAKLLLTFAGVTILHLFRTKRNNLIFTASMILVAVYSVLTCWHVAGFLKCVL